MPLIEDMQKMRNMSEEEILHQVAELKKELFNLRVRVVTKDLPAHTEISKRRKRLARLKTILNQKKAAAAAAAR